MAAKQVHLSLSDHQLLIERKSANPEQRFISICEGMLSHIAWMKTVSLSQLISVFSLCPTAMEKSAKHMLIACVRSLENCGWIEIFVDDDMQQQVKLTTLGSEAIHDG